MLDRIVTDWGGFEKFVASLHETGEVTVEQNVVLVGKSGAPRQIDVLLRHNQTLYQHLVVIECKWWNTPVERLHVDAFATTVREVGAAKGVIFSRRGFQSGAVDQARHDSIDLFHVRDLTDDEWGQPGRVVDMFLQIIQPSLGNPNLDLVWVGHIGPEKPSVSVELAFGPEGPASASPLIADGLPTGDTLEGEMLKACEHAVQTMMPQVGVFDNGAEGNYYVLCHVKMEPPNGYMVHHGNFILMARSVMFDVALKFDQSRLTIDRAANYLFAVAVENFVTRAVASASRTTDASTTTISYAEAKPQGPNEEPFQNGMVAKVKIKGMFPFEETASLTHVPFADVVKPFSYVPPQIPL